MKLLLLLFCYHLLLGLAGAGAGAEQHKYCVSDSPLDTPYFSPFYKTVRPAVGCVRAAGSGDLTEVHVIRLSQPVEDVFLYVTGGYHQHSIINMPTIYHVDTVTVKCLSTISTRIKCLC